MLDTESRAGYDLFTSEGSPVDTSITVAGHELVLLTPCDKPYCFGEHEHVNVRANRAPGYVPHHLTPEARTLVELVKAALTPDARGGWE